MTDCESQLQQEREKLNRLVDEALKNSTPIDETHEIMNQTKRVEALIEKLEGNGGETGGRRRALRAGVAAATIDRHRWINRVP